MIMDAEVSVSEARSSLTIGPSLSRSLFILPPTVRVAYSGDRDHGDGPPENAEQLANARGTETQR